MNLALRVFPAGLEAVHLPVLSSALGLFLVSTLPVLAGMRLRQARPSAARAVETRMGAFGLAFIGVVIVIAVWSERSHVLPALARAGVAALLLNLLAVSTAWGIAALAGLSRGQRLAVGLECGLQNFAMAAFIALTLLRDRGPCSFPPSPTASPCGSRPSRCSACRAARSPPIQSRHEALGSCRALPPAPCPPPRRVELSPMAGYRAGGSFNLAEQGGAVEVKDSGAFGLHLSVQVAEDGELEALYARQATRLQTDALFAGEPLFDLTLDIYQLAGNYLFREDGEALRPYIGVGLGATRLVPEPAGRESETRFSASIAGGLKAYLGSHFGFRFEVRGFFTVLESDSSIFCAQVCLVRTSGTDLSQAEVRGGLIFRF